MNALCLPRRVDHNCLASPSCLRITERAFHHTHRPHHHKLQASLLRAASHRSAPTSTVTSWWWNRGNSNWNRVIYQYNISHCCFSARYTTCMGRYCAPHRYGYNNSSPLWKTTKPVKYGVIRPYIEVHENASTFPGRQSCLFVLRDRSVQTAPRICSRFT